MSIQSITNKYFEENRRAVCKDYINISKILGAKGLAAVNFAEMPAWTSDAQEEYKKNDYVCAKALLTMAILNGPTDIAELVSAAEEIRELFGGKKANDYNHRIAQHPFSFFRGTLLHDYLNPNSEKCINKEWAMKIIKADKSLFETKFGKWIRKKLGIEIGNALQTNICEIDNIPELPNYVPAFVLKAPNEFADLTARALLRTTKFGTITLGGLGAIHAAYRIKEGKDIKQELAKAAIEVATTITAVGYLGAVGAKYGRTLGSITGTALGVAVGAASHKYADKLFEK